MVEQEFDNIKKTKRNKHITECSIKRRTTGCGICGSENIVIQGVKYCDECGIEEEILIDSTYIFSVDAKRICDCICIYEHGKGKRKRIYKFDYTKSITVGKCLDCGAVRSSYCPNCGKRFKRCWKATNGSLFCVSCGYRKTIKE